MKPPVRWKHSVDGDPFARELLSSARPTRPIPETSRMRGARRVARLASAPLVGLGVGFLSKAVAAGFAFGAASAVAVVTTVPAVRARLLASTAFVSRAGDAPLPALEHAAPACSPPAVRDPSPAIEPASAAEMPPPTANLVEPRPLPTNRTRHHDAVLEQRSGSKAEPPVATTYSPPAADSAAALPADRTDEAMSAEVTMLLEARRQAATDPASALVTLEQHARSFPSGSLAMERDVLIVETLARSGRRPEAVRRALTILERAPNAFYAARLRQLIER
jgi:hypothetical protein